MSFPKQTLYLLLCVTETPLEPADNTPEPLKIVQ